MKTTVIVALLVLVCLFASGQNKPVMTISPDRPTADAVFTLTYSSDSPDAALAKATSIYAEAMIFGESDQPHVVSAAMTKVGATWTATLAMGDPTAKLVAFRFVTPDGNADDNHGDVWETLIRGTDGKPVPGAIAARGDLFRTGGRGYFGHKRDLAAARDEFRKELADHPDDLRARLSELETSYGAEKNEAMRAKVHGSLDAIQAEASGNEKLAGAVINLYRLLGDTSKAMALKTAELKTRPHGLFAKKNWLSELTMTKDPERASALAHSILAEFPDLTPLEKRTIQAATARAFDQNERYEDAMAFVKEMDLGDGTIYNQIAWNLVEKNTMIDKAVEWAKEGVEISRHPNPALNNPLFSVEIQKKSDESNLGAILDTYGAALLLAGNNTEAETVMKEACATMRNEDPDANGRYERAMLLNKNYSGAQTFGIECLKAGKANDTLKADLRVAYLATPGKTVEDYEKAVSEIHNQIIDQMRKDLAGSRTHEPSKDFTVDDLDGKPVTLSSFNGKVVIIDYWATWCGPCKESFPYLQQVYTKYKDNSGIVFMAINTWDMKDSSFAVKAANARSFMTGYSYTMPAYIDKGSAELYGVEGIPTQIIIDRSGMVAFRNIGFEGPQMVDRLGQMIELLLNESTGMR